MLHHNYLVREMEKKYVLYKILPFTPYTTVHAISIDFEHVIYTLYHAGFCAIALRLNSGFLWDRDCCLAGICNNNDASPKTIERRGVRERIEAVHIDRRRARRPRGDRIGDAGGRSEVDRGRPFRGRVCRAVAHPERRDVSIRRKVHDRRYIRRCFYSAWSSQKACGRGAERALHISASADAKRHNKTLLFRIIKIYYCIIFYHYNIRFARVGGNNKI